MSQQKGSRAVKEMWTKVHPSRGVETGREERGQKKAEAARGTHETRTSLASLEQEFRVVGAEDLGEVR